MAVEETLARYKAWVAEHPQVDHFLEKVKSNLISLIVNLHLDWLLHHL